MFYVYFTISITGLLFLLMLLFGGDFAFICIFCFCFVLLQHLFFLSHPGSVFVERLGRSYVMLQWTRKLAMSETLKRSRGPAKLRLTSRSLEMFIGSGKRPFEST